MNPFKTNTMPVDRTCNLLYREKEIQEIRDHIENRQQTVILGVEGVGKTSLLNCAFNNEYRKKKALEGTLISSVTEFPSNLKSDAIYIHFAEMIINSASILSQCGKVDEMREILESCNIQRELNLPPEIYFENIIGIMHDKYDIVMVVNNFERFTSSKEVTVGHHGTLHKLLEKIQFIVATNYDFSEDSLPSEVSGSLLLMKFGTNKILINGWTAEQTADYINSRLASDNVKFSEQLIGNIYSITGGIPFLIDLAANYAYDYIANNGFENGLKFSALYNQEIVQTLLFRWCKLINPMQITALRHLIDATYDNTIDITKLRSLQQRGLLKFRDEINESGYNTTNDKEYDFCCRLFGIFCNEDGKLEQAADKNPLKAPSSNENASMLSKDKYIKAADKMMRELEIQLNDAYYDAETEYNEYKKLGKRISAKSVRLNKLKEPMDKATELKSAVITGFGEIKAKISKATDVSELEAILESTNILYNELRLKADELVNSINS